MKRAFLGWCGITLLISSAVCLLYWSVSTLTDAANFNLVFGQGSSRVQMLSTNGNITFCDHIDNLEIIDHINKSGKMEPTPSHVYGWSLPGFGLHYITFNQSSSIWSLNLSLLVPIILMIILSGFCLHRYGLMNQRVFAQSMNNSLDDRRI